MRTSIIIVNYHVKKELFSCLDSIYKSKPKTSFEIVVVDNDDQKTISADLKRRFPQIKYVPNENRGFAQGNNIGAKFALGKHLFFLNPDTKVLENSIDNLYEFLEKHGKAGIVSPLLVDEQLKPFSTQSRKELTIKKAIYSFSFLRKLFPDKNIYNDPFFKKWDKRKAIEVDTIPGAALLISKELFNRIKGFDEKFFLYFEENDISRRVKNLGFQLYIDPKSKIIHQVGQSTKNLRNMEKIFRQSRFYYFRKNFGLIKAVPTELFLRIDKGVVLLFSIICLAIFLRLYTLSSILPFIGDTAWFYISARDLIIDHKIPLVGIPTSHIWLHQGAFWTYILAIILKQSNFNPFTPAYFTSLLDIGTLLIIYFFAKEMFGKKIALISSVFYATSPLIVSIAQVPYHTSIIPFFTALLLFSVYKWTCSRILFFPIAVFLLTILYNLEIATMSLGIILIVLIVFGLINKKSWALEIIKPKILFISTIALTVPMIPMILYDINHGFPQTAKVVVWIFYKIALQFGYPPLNPSAGSEAWTTFFPFLLNLGQRFYFTKTQEFALFLFLVSFSFALYRLILSKFKDINLIIIFFFLGLPLISYIVAKTNSTAYIPMLFPQAVIILGYFFGSFKRTFMPFSILIVLFIVLINSHYILTTNYFGRPTLKERIEKAKIIIDTAKGERYNLIGVGEGSQYESFISNQKYLTWWLGHEPSEKDEKLKLLVFPDGTIKIDKKITK